MFILYLLSLIPNTPDNISHDFRLAIVLPSQSISISSISLPFSLLIPLSLFLFLSLRHSFPSCLHLTYSGCNCRSLSVHTTKSPHVSLLLIVCLSICLSIYNYLCFIYNVFSRTCLLHSLLVLVPSHVKAIFYANLSTKQCHKCHNYSENKPLENIVCTSSSIVVGQNEITIQFSKYWFHPLDKIK